ncbi:hypothetical protein ACWJJH_02405 [Endozoicomonadaceae bacterium StTr2]
MKKLAVFSLSLLIAGCKTVAVDENFEASPDLITGSWHCIEGQNLSDNMRMTLDSEIEIREDSVYTSKSRINGRIDRKNRAVSYTVKESGTWMLVGNMLYTDLDLGDVFALNAISARITDSFINKYMRDRRNKNAAVQITYLDQQVMRYQGYRGEVAECSRVQNL